MDSVRKYAFAMAGVIQWCLVWFLMDRYLFAEVHESGYYLAVGISYFGGATGAFRAPKP
jgi:hypothetical protein